MPHTLLKRLICGVVLGFCAALTTCFGTAVAEKTGISIFDSLFIADNSSLSIYGNVYLNRAHVLGNGNLIIQGESQSTIVSDHSEINNLEVITPSKVSLEGELTVNHSLTVQSGIFDISAGKLAISNSTEIQLLNGAIIQRDTKIFGLPRQGGQHPSFDFSGKAIRASFYKADQIVSWEKKTREIMLTLNELQAYKYRTYVPPKRKMVFHSIFLNQKPFIHNQMIS